MLITQLSFAQKNFVVGTLGLTNGEEIQCEFVLKIKNGRDGEVLDKSHKFLKYKMPGSDDIQKIEHDELDFILVNTETTKILVRRLHYNRLRNKKPPVKSKDKMWVQFRGGCDEIQGYLLIQEFEVDRNGQIWETYIDGMGAYLLMRDGEDVPTQVGYVFLRKVMTQKGFDKQRKKMLDLYFKGDKKGMEFISDKSHITQKELSEYIAENCDQ